MNREVKTVWRMNFIYGKKFRRYARAFHLTGALNVTRRSINRASSVRLSPVSFDVICERLCICQMGFSLWLAVNNRFPVTVTPRPYIMPQAFKILHWCRSFPTFRINCLLFFQFNEKMTWQTFALLIHKKKTLVSSLRQRLLFLVYHIILSDGQTFQINGWFFC